MMPDTCSDAAVWVPAIGTIAAVAGAAWVSAGEARASRRREAVARQEAFDKEARTLRTSREAALNLAILAATQIRDLDTLLQDEVRRRRLTQVSPSRNLMTLERLLTTFPIQSLCDATAMVAYAYFPGALETAAEICANLEAAVRSTEDANRAEVFRTYARQMTQLDKSSREHMAVLRLALAGEGLALTEPADRRPSRRLGAAA